MHPGFAQTVADALPHQFVYTQERSSMNLRLQQTSRVEVLTPTSCRISRRQVAEFTYGSRCQVEWPIFAEIHHCVTEQLIILSMVLPDKPGHTRINEDDRDRRNS